MKTPLNISEQSLISCPVGILIKQSFRHQAALCWHTHPQVYAGGAGARPEILWVENNLGTEPRVKGLAWLDELGAPYFIAKPYYEIFDCLSKGVNVPLNIKAAVAQIIDQFQCARLPCGDNLRRPLALINR